MTNQSTTRKNIKSNNDLFPDDKDLFQKLIRTKDKQLLSPENIINEHEPINDKLTYIELLKNSSSPKKKSLSPFRYDIPQPSKLVLFYIIKDNYFH